MKKITTLFFLFILIILLIKSNQGTEQVMLVNFVDDESYEKVYLKFEDGSLTTKNFKIYFNSEMKIISLYTSNNCFKNNRYLFQFKNLDSNLNSYIDYYNDLLANDISYYFNGTPISIVELYISTNELNKILKKNKDIRYSQKLCGNYH